MHHAESRATGRFLAQSGQELAAVQDGEQQRIEAGATAAVQPRGGRRGPAGNERVQLTVMAGGEDGCTTVQEGQVRADHGGDRLVATAGGQDTSDQVQDVAGHRATPQGPAGGVAQEAVRHAHRRVDARQTRRQRLLFLYRPATERAGGAGDGRYLIGRRPSDGAGEGLGEGVQAI
ncbi:hypothetical protein RND61_02780 [Streptomyces sp. TRM76323]|uniref:Uncharacterized protein n=1 Tax=Streptomyces tamarix TaxID=3078565 RepID=A0ABU3QE32_9ACTN|nr:hypothetical protein [Streptomyces tamarix]MDT9681014.1 hypothetical protein [Streptomyces tamarix]